MADVDPIPEGRTTNSDLARGMNQLHRCLEGARTDIRKTNTAVATVGTKVHDIDTRLARVEGAQEAMARGFNLPTPVQMAAAKDEGSEAKVHAKWGGMERWQGFWTMVGAAGGGLLLFKIAVEAVPSLFHALMTVH